MRHTDVVADMNAKLNHACKLAAEEAVRKAREMKPIPAFSYCRPELGKKRKRGKILTRAMEETHEQIRAIFGLPERSAGE